MKKLLSLALALTMSLFLVACGGAESIAPNSFYNTELGYAVSLGMSKSEIDKLLGEGTKSVYYDYVDGLSIEYEDGNASYIRISGRRCPWVVANKIGLTDDADSVQEAFGEQEIEGLEILGTTTYCLQYYFNAKGEPSPYLDRSVTVTIHLDSDRSTIESINMR